MADFDRDGLIWLQSEEWSAWRLRVRAEHLGSNLTPARRDALYALQGLLCAGNGQPTDADVAALAGCSTRTVRRARADAQALGLLSWQQTRRLVGGMWRRGPNTYTLRVPGGPVSSGQAGRARKAERKKVAQEAVALPTATEARAALAAIAARRAVQLGIAPG